MTDSRPGDGRVPRIFDVFTSANLHVVARLYDPKEPVCVSFASGGAPREPFAASVAAQYGFNLVAVTVKEMDWFQYPELPDAEAAIRAVVRDSSRVMTYGFSMGAYGALICSKAVGAHVVLAFSPQAAMGPTCPPAETRWADHRVRIAAELGFPHDDLAARLTPTGDVIIGYDPLDADAEHVRLIQAVRPIRRLFIPLAAHDTLRFLVRMGNASRVLLDVLHDRFCLPSLQAELHRWRRAFQQPEGIATALLARKRPVPPKLLLRTAWESHQLSTARMRQFAIEAVRQQNAEAMLPLIWNLLLSPRYSRGPNLVPDLLTFAPVAATAAEFDDLVAQVDGPGLESFVPVVERHIVLAILLGAAGRTAEALQRLREASAQITAWDPVNVGIADVFAFLGDHDQAAAFRRRVAVRTDPSFLTFEMAARRHEREGRWDDAIKVWREAAAVGLSPARVGLKLARALFQLSDFAQALMALQPALVLPQPSPDALRLAATCHVRLNDDRAALPFLEAAAAAAPNDHQAPRQLANALTRLGDLQGALDAARKAHAIRPSDAGAAQIERLRLRLGLPA